MSNNIRPLSAEDGSPGGLDTQYGDMVDAIFGLNDTLRRGVAPSVPRVREVISTPESYVEFRKNPPKKVRTHCKRGHVLQGPALYIDPAGVRRCRICRSAAQKRRD